MSNLLSSIRVLGDASHRFATSCVVEIRQPDRDEIRELVMTFSGMPVAALDRRWHLIGGSVVSSDRQRSSHPRRSCFPAPAPTPAPSAATPAPFAEPSRSLFFSGAVVTAVCSAIEWVRRVRQVIKRVRRVRQVIKRVRRVRHWSDSSGGSANQSAETFVESVTADQFAVWRDGGRPSPEPPMRRYGGQHSRQTSACGKSVCSPR